MPYTIRKNGNEFCIYKADSGEKVGCSATRSDAEASVRARYANEKALVPQYKSTFTDAQWSQMIAPRYNDLIDTLMQAYHSTQHKELKGLIDKSLDNTIASLASLLGWQADSPFGHDPDVKTQAKGEKVDKLTFVKQVVDGQERLRVLMRGTNQFKDRHKEIITEAAHKDYEQWVQETGRFPEFWIWHLKGSRWGQADFVGYSDGFLTVSGLVDEGKEELAQTMAELDLGVSHGFIALKSQDGGVIEAYRSFEFSVLPREAAANVWTAMKIAKEASLPLSENQFKVLTEDLKIPTEVVRGWEQENKGFGDALRASVEFKEQNPETPVTTPTTGTGTDSTTPVVPASTTPTPSDGGGAVTLEAIGALIDAKLDGIKGELAEVKQKQAEQSMDFTAKVNQVFDGVPRGLPLGYQATKANDNLTGTETAKETEDWFMDPSNPLIALPNGRMA